KAEEAMRSEVDLQVALEAQRKADQAAADLVAAERSSRAKNAELSQSRGEYGSVASLRTFWDVADIDRATLDLEALRPHLSADALERACRAWVKAAQPAPGGPAPVLRGCRVFENTSTVVR